jgi:hypothetical protein
MTELKDLIGKHTLGAVDFDTQEIESWPGSEYTETANVCRFRLNGTVFAAIEDPSDGYRSHMRDLVVVPNADMKNVFPAVEVLGVHRDRDGSYSQSDILELIDTTTAKCVLSVGTSNTDDYYPSFVSSFQPENMATNALSPDTTPQHDQGDGR